ncbi:MAG: hypothetical protein K0S86_3169 [Geminicoccaceae bacterium]|nr:hypothetical protein [Geminicoccaceae bacterium]
MPNGDGERPLGTPPPIAGRSRILFGSLGEGASRSRNDPPRRLIRLIRISPVRRAASLSGSPPAARSIAVIPNR